MKYKSSGARSVWRNSLPAYCTSGWGGLLAIVKITNDGHTDTLLTLCCFNVVCCWELYFASALLLLPKIKLEDGGVGFADGGARLDVDLQTFRLTPSMRNDCTNFPSSA